MNQLTTRKPPDAVQADKAAVNSLMLTAGLQVEERLSTDFDFQGYIITSHVGDDQLAEAYEALSATMLPAEDNEIAKALLKLRALTSHRNEGADIDIILEAYVEKLKDYPRDAVLESLGKMSDQSKWFPAWTEIKDDVEFRCRHRMQMLKAIERKRDEQGRRAILREVQQRSA
jgi:hypothetical protein